MPDDVYERDILVWSELQATLLARLSRGERVNDAIDWENLIEEVRDVGRSELRACESPLFRAMVHLAKAGAWPRSLSHSHWMVEATVFLADARRAFTPSMRQRIDLGNEYRRALAAIRRAEDQSGTPLALPTDCPWTLDGLLAGDVEAMIGGLDAR